MKNIIYGICLLFLLTTQVAADPAVTFTFDSAEEEALFHKLSNELRCLVCQNQSIADSNAGLAKDLRTEMYEMLRSGKSEDEIIAFMVKRYGDYVLYRPPFKASTVLLWFGPVLIFGIGLFFAVRFIRAQKKDAAPVELSANEVERLKKLQAQGRELK